MIKILFLAADTSGAMRLRLMDEHRQIDERIRVSKNRDNLSLVTRLGIRPVDLTQAILDEQPTVVHFSGHGDGGSIFVQSNAGRTMPVTFAAVAKLFAAVEPQIHCVVLNACYSADEVDIVAQHVEYVIRMAKPISDHAAIAFSVGFYAGLGAGRSIEESYKVGVAQIALEGFEETDVPVLSARSKLTAPLPAGATAAPATRDVTSLSLVFNVHTFNYSTGA